MKKRIFAILLTLALLVGTTLTVYAETASVTITGGSLSESIGDVTFSGVALDGTDQIATSSSNSWTATDARGTGLGWNLTILGTDFQDGTGTPYTIDIDAADQKFQIQLLDANIGVTAGNTKPTSAVTSLTDVPTVTALKFVTAAVDTGMGTYTLAPNFSLMLPAETYVGTGTYNSTITVTANSGP